MEFLYNLDDKDKLPITWKEMSFFRRSGSNFLLKDIVETKYDQKEHKQFIQFKAFLPVSILLCFTKFDSGKKQLIGLHVNHHTVNANTNVGKKILDSLETDQIPTIGEVTTIPCKGRFITLHWLVQSK